MRVLGKPLTIAFPRLSQLRAEFARIRKTNGAPGLSVAPDDPAEAAAVRKVTLDKSSPTASFPGPCKAAAKILSKRLHACIANSR